MILRPNRPVAMGWHRVANATPGQQDPSFLPPLENSVDFVVVDLLLLLLLLLRNRDLLKFWYSSTLVFNFLQMHCQFDCDEISSQILYHVIASGWFSHPWSTGQATGLRLKYS